MKYLPTNTLAHFNTAPQTHLHNLSALPTKVFAESTRVYREQHGKVSPNTEAVTFYTLNHCASLVRKQFTLNEPLPEWAQSLMQSYTDVCMEQGERLLHYMLSITTRELRHLPTAGKTATFWKKMEKEGSAASVAFVKKNMGEEQAADEYMNHPPTDTIGQYIGAISYGFWKGWGDYAPGAWEGQWHGGYGGPKWALVADAAKAMLHGETSMEMLVDTAYTLAHNGGPIFNKPLLYSGQDANALLTALDVQRAGQMLDLMLATETLHVKKTPEAEAAVALIQTHLPEAVKGFVDWALVDDLRPAAEKADSPSKYTKLLQKPVVGSKYKQPVAAKKKAAPVAPPVVVPSTLVIEGQTVTVTGQWQVFPGVEHAAAQTVVTYERQK